MAERTAAPYRFPGVSESRINLAIARRLELIMGLYGVDTVLLRTEDISLHSEGASTLREKKVSDLHNRVDRVNSIDNAVLISIHQNSYSDSQYRGAQVFFCAYGRQPGLWGMIRRRFFGCP